MSGFGGFSFGASNPQTTQTGSLFGTNPTTTNAQSTTGGFNFGSSGFGGNALGGGASAGFSFPRPNAPAAAAVTAAPTAGAGGFSLGSTSLGATKPAAGLNFGGGTLGGFGMPTQATGSNPTATTTAAAAATGSTFSFGGASGLTGGLMGSTPATTTQTLSFGGLGGLTATTAVDGGLKLGGLAAPAASANAVSAPLSSLGGGFKLGTGAATNTAAAAGTTASTSLLGGLLTGNKPATTVAGQLGGGFSLGTSVATSSSTATSAGFTLGGLTSLPAAAVTTSSAPSGGFGLPSSSLAAATSAPVAATSGFSLTFSGNSVSLPAPTSVTTAAGCAATTVAPAMNYRQLEEAINKWTHELEEQEAVFLEQATQVNAWDRLLIENGDMITQLNQDVERVVADQQRLDQELDFILGQQSELEDMLKPLEQTLEQLPPITYQQHADLEREHTYKLAENVDSQLKRMASDLKEIVEHLNSGTSTQDNNDPLFQIAKILNAHLDSLKWIDQKTGILQRRVEDVARHSSAQHKQQTYR